MRWNDIAIVHTKAYNYKIGRPDTIHQNYFTQSNQTDGYCDKQEWCEERIKIMNSTNTKQSMTMISSEKYISPKKAILS